jgi:hypothetical protein
MRSWRQVEGEFRWVEGAIVAEVVIERLFDNLLLMSFEVMEILMAAFEVRKQ